MKKRVLVLAVAGCLLLSGCKAMLARSYSAVTPHVDRPTTAEDPSVLRVENYRELVSAVLYLVSEGEEEGVIQLHNYDGEEESDLTAACLEVSTQDPFGAYAVDYIKHELSRVVSYYEATLAIHYRRSEAQRKSIVSVNGDQAIREALLTALEGISPEAVLRVPYFFGGEDAIKNLLREAYYAHPELALGLPEAQVNLYPDSGRERIVEIALTYPEEVETLGEKREELAHRVADLLPSGERPAWEEAAKLAIEKLWGDGEGVYDPEGGSTAYAALVEGRANSEGLALGYALLCQELGLDYRLRAGELEGEKRFWVAIVPPNGELQGELLCVDPCRGPVWAEAAYPEGEFLALGYFFPET